MLKDITKLAEIGKKTSRNIIGLMSGTSLDGLDIAYLKIDGNGINTKIDLIKFETFSYPDEVKIKISTIFAKKTIDFQYLNLLNAWLGSYHADLINKFLKKNNINPNEVDLIASHGQTVYHSPKKLHKITEFPNATLQIGDGDHIAVKTGIITISDFRQKHIAAGGEGAPLAVYGDFLIFSKKNENRIMLNIGGIANFTYLPGSNNAKEVFVSDTGPGNTLIDAFVKMNFPTKSYDQDAKIALKGKMNIDLLTELLNHEFFKQEFPKTTGPELFNVKYVQNAQKKSGTLDISVFDLLATLTRFTAESIAKAINKSIEKGLKYNIYLSGGGMHNPLLVGWLKELIGYSIGKSDILGVNGDAKEAILFAILANESISGSQIDYGLREGVPSISFGKISFPN